MILAIDLGNYNIKTSEGINFSSTFTEEVSSNPVGEEIIKFNNKTYTMTKGNFDNKFNKSKKEYMPNLLYAIAKSSTKSDTTFDIVLGVPLDNLGIADTFKEELEGKEFDFEYNNIQRKIKINRLATVGEGISSYYYLTDAERSKDIMIVDIGGRTVNVATFIKKKLEKKFTINMGMIDLYNDIKTRVNETGENFNTEEIERLIKKDLIKDTYLEEAQFIKEIFNKIEFSAKVNTYDIYFTGGGSVELEEQLKAYTKDQVAAYFIENPLFSNVNGNKIIANIKWSDK